MRKFNTTGPCFPDEHYMLPALDRLPGIRELVAGGNYFVVHAPRQTGKTTALQALVREINEKGDMFAIYCTLETLQGASDSNVSNIAIRDLIADNAEMSPHYSAVPGAPELRSDRGGVGLAIRTVLQNLCRAVLSCRQCPDIVPSPTARRVCQPKDDSVPQVHRASRDAGRARL